MTKNMLVINLMKLFKNKKILTQKFRKYCKFYFLKWTMSTILSDFLNWNFFPKLEQM